MKKAKIIVLSSRADLLEQARRLGADAAMTKPDASILSFKNSKAAEFFEHVYGLLSLDIKPMLATPA